MKLSQVDADLFYRLMWGLQFYVNQQRRVLSDVGSVEEYAALSMQEKVEVRDVLWENPDLIKAYVQQNPDGLTNGELDIVRKWERYVKGTFKVFRYLKKHTIFVGESAQVYGVLGLYSSFEEMYYGRRLPIMVEAVLLPFQGKIIYDGIVRGYNITFGGGIRSSLKEEYMAAKQNGRIIVTLEPELVEPKRPRLKPSEDWRLTVDDLVEATEKMKGGPVVQRAAFTLLRASAKLTQIAVHNPDDLDELWRQERRVRMALTQLQTVLERAER